MPAADIVAAARTLWEARPVAFYTWSGLEQHSNTTQTIRAIDLLYALTGSLDVPGGNVLFAAVPSNPIDGAELLSPQQRAKALGVAAAAAGPGAVRVRHRRGPLHRGPRRPALPGARAGELRRQPGDGPRRQRPRARRARGARLLRPRRPVHEPRPPSWPTSCCPWRARSSPRRCRIGFEVSQAAQSLVQLRQPLVAAARRGPLGPADRLRPRDAPRSGRAVLATATSRRPGATSSRRAGSRSSSSAPSPPGVRVPLQTRHRKYADPTTACRAGSPPRRARSSCTRRRWPTHGYPPLPEFEEPRTSPRSRPDLAAAIPAGPQLREVAVLLRDPAPPGRRACAAARRTRRSSCTPRRPRPRHRRRRLGLHRHAARQRPRPREAQRQPRPARGLRPARLVAGLRRTRPARLSALRPGQCEPQPGAAAGAERSDQRELPAARIGLRGAPRVAAATIRVRLTRSR